MEEGEEDRRNPESELPNKIGIIKAARLSTTIKDQLCRL